jgi:DNA-binding CsgD family transcriptional regulator
MVAMEQTWLLLSLTCIITGFGLLVALVFLKRLVPLNLPPVITPVVALVVMGGASFLGVYLRLLEISRSLPAHRLINALAWGLAAFAMLWFVNCDRRLTTVAERGHADARIGEGHVRHLSQDLPYLFPVIAGVVIFLGALLAAHPPENGLLAGSPYVQTAVMIAVEIVVVLLALWAGLRAFKRSKSTISRPWRAYLRGFGAALLLLTPANLLDYGLSVALRVNGTIAKDGIVFAAGFGIVNIILIASIVRSFSLTGTAAAPAIPEPLRSAFGITSRECEVLEKLLEGKSDREIAEELFISPRTVDTHLRSVFRKCQVHSRLQLTRLVASYGEFRKPE